MWYTLIKSTIYDENYDVFSLIRLSCRMKSFIEMKIEPTSHGILITIVIFLFGTVLLCVESYATEYAHVTVSFIFSRCFSPNHLMSYVRKKENSSYAVAMFGDPNARVIWETTTIDEYAFPGAFCRHSRPKMPEFFRFFIRGKSVRAKLLTQFPVKIRLSDEWNMFHQIKFCSKIIIN